MTGAAWNSTLRPGGPLKRTKGLTASTGLTARTPLKRGTRLRPVSAKRAKENAERRAMLATKYPGRPLCEVPWCTRWADDAHEPKFRSRLGSITDPNNVRAICRAHHDWVHDHPLEAHELGLAVNSWE